MKRLFQRIHGTTYVEFEKIINLIQNITESNGVKWTNNNEDLGLKSNFLLISFSLFYKYNLIRTKIFIKKITC